MNCGCRSVSSLAFEQVKAGHNLREALKRFPTDRRFGVNTEVVSFVLRKAVFRDVLEHDFGGLGNA